MRAFLIAAVISVATAAQAGVVIDTMGRQVIYDGGLEQPHMMGDSASTTALGVFNEGFTDDITTPNVAASGVSVSQLSSIDLVSGSLFIDATSDVDEYATSVVGGGIADSISWSELEVVFTTDEITVLSVDVVVSSSLGVFYDGPGEGVVDTGHTGSLLICEVGGACLADLLAEDVTDNGMAVSQGILDTALLPPGQYAIELLAVSQTLVDDIGSAAGSAGFSGEISVEPLPEPASATLLVAGCAVLATLHRWRR
jgi:hypothetical protein